ncbi:centrosomal protein of 120 kDa-like [Hetaerina americana]|uniref:centrosomal protein of 120 kDa-like n=1 Tax=Hetaerina americana TaxID=62018 RepID=UPI003A7F1183
MEDIKAVVLEIKEGKGFEAFRQDIIIQAELDGVTTKTLPCRASREGIVCFNNDLIWELQRKTLRRMKISSTPLKIECFSVTNEKKKTKVGYLLLKLKSFKEARQCVDVKGEWLKLLGISSQAKQSTPSIFLKYYIQDSDNVIEKIAKKGNEILSAEELSEIKAVLTSKKGVIEIGPVDDSTDCFILCIKLADVKNLPVLIPSEQGNSGEYVFLYTLLGYDVQREPFKDLAKPTPQEKMFIKIKSEMSILKLYLETNPFIMVRLMDKDMVLGCAHIDLRLLLPENGMESLPTSIELHLDLKSPLSAGAQEKGNEASVLISLGFDIARKVLNSPSSVSHSSWSKLEKNADPFPAEESDRLSEKNDRDGENKVMKDQGTSITQGEESNFQPVLNESLAQKVVQELEDWKDAQKEIFIEKLRSKEKQHLDLLSSEWQMKRDKLENNLSAVISQNNTLMSSLKDAIADLQERKKRVQEKEKRINFIKEDIERRFSMKLQELQVASKRMEDDCNHKVETLETHRNDQELKYLELQGENLTLKEKVKELEAEVDKLMKGSLTKYQTASLLSEVKSLQEKLDISEKSKMFFKEQWAKAVRESHRLKTENQESLQIQIRHNKEELKQLGLCPETINNEDNGNEEPRLPPHVQKLVHRRNEMNESGDTINACKSKMGLYHTASAMNSCSSRNVAQGKLQSLIEERNNLIKKGWYSLEDQALCDLNQQIRTLMTTCGDTSF